MLTREELLAVYRNLENPKLDQESVINAMAKAVEVALEKALVPTMFWDADDPQEPQQSVHDVLVSIDAKEGSQVEVQRAVGLENMTVKVTGITDFGEYQWEVVDNNPLSAKAIETILTKKILLGRSWDSNSDQQAAVILAREAIREVLDLAMQANTEQAPALWASKADCRS